MQVIERATTPQGVNIQIEDWHKDYYFMAEASTVATYPQATKTDNTIYFGWDDTRWYRYNADFEYVDFIMNYILELKDYSYAIIGEEIDDNDIDCNGDIVCISITRSFEDDKMPNFQENDLVKIAKNSEIDDDISNNYVGKLAYINEIDNAEDCIFIQICGTDTEFWISKDRLKFIAREE